MEDPGGRWSSRFVVLCLVRAGEHAGALFGGDGVAVAGNGDLPQADAAITWVVQQTGF